MSVATLIPCLRVPSTSCCFRPATATRNSCVMTVMNSQADGSLRRPVAPPLLSPPLPPSLTKPVAPWPPQPSGLAAVQVREEGKGVVTLELQRQKAKDIQEYFKLKKLEEASQGPFFGFLPKNEISNGRWGF